MIPGITPAKISAIIAHIMLLVAFNVAISPALAALYILYTLRNTIIETTNSTRYTRAGSIKKAPSPTAEAKAKVAKTDKAAPIQTITNKIEKMKAISMYVFTVPKFVLDVGGGGGGGFEYDIFFLKTPSLTFL